MSAILWDWDEPALAKAPEKKGNGTKVGVFLCAGGKPIISRLPGIDSDKVVLASDVIADPIT